MLSNCLNENDIAIKQTLLTNRQQQFNQAKEKIANQSIEETCKNSLLSCKCSEPLPSNPYALPKDHKTGNLKGKPIISTINSSVRSLSI